MFLRSGPLNYVPEQVLSVRVGYLAALAPEEWPGARPQCEQGAGDDVLAT